MKNKILIAAVCTTLFSCDNQEQKVVSLNRDRDSLMTIINERDGSINEFLTSFGEIEENLAAVAKKQNVISMNVDKKQGELNQTAKDRINSEINAINELMEKNKKQIAELNSKLKNSKNKAAGFEKIINSLNEQIKLKDAELAELNAKLISLNTQVAQLQTSVDTLGSITARQTQTIADQTTSLHTAYFIVGESKELQESKVIAKSGGVLGIGKTPKMSQDVDNSKFTKIDYTQTMSIPVNSDAKIVTVHPAGSYELEKDVKDKDKIIDVRITNPDKFWSTSKYLVVMKN